MSRGSKRFVFVGLGAAALVAATAIWLVRHTPRDRGGSRPEDRGSASAINYGARGSGLSDEVPAAAPVPETPETIAAKAEESLATWRNAIMARDAEAVVQLDRLFTGMPERYTAVLRKAATSDGDERVRAFSTRVLGKLKDPALASLFEERLGDKSPFVRQNAAWALGELAAGGDGRAAAKHAVAELRQAQKRDPAPDVREAAKGALARLE
jgi:hypothetical protein